ncbi:TetR/AcrR family transcriptional regulator [Pararhizobium haloflavum]|uniref:TetR/AcrR family transcriptional regulator n=1 Tax=Pararhizobium haloflavum TaxID=2037914 RepID=UPI000C1A159C|nr:TetR family transcriptional regulator [Pararhizobium haloflavum]
MQDRSRRTNKDRSQTTRTQLIDAARTLFVERGYAGTGTPELVAAAGVTRGALYHHFADKQALFRAVVEREARDVATTIERSAADIDDPVEAILRGGETYLATIAEAGRVRLLLIDAPAVLGRSTVDAIDAETGGATLEAGLAAAEAAGRLKPLPIAATARLLSAAYDRAALAIAAGEDAGPWHEGLKALVLGLTASSKR